jgi:hypothetical protein
VGGEADAPARARRWSEGRHKGLVRVKEEVTLFAELALARRLERAEGDANAKFVEARARLFPESGAAWIEVAGAYAMFDGVASPCTQTFGLGIFETATSRALDDIETFFRDRGAPVSHDTCPLAGIELAALLSKRGYAPIEFSSVMYRPVADGVNAAGTLNDRIHVRTIEAGEADVWVQTMTNGWSEEHPELKDSLLELGQISTQREDSVCFLAETGGQPIACGGLTIHGGVALFAGACTIPEARLQGAQLALLDARRSGLVLDGLTRDVGGVRRTLPDRADSLSLAVAHAVPGGGGHAPAGLG